MVRHREIICDVEDRRDLVRKSPVLNGIDYVDVVTAPPADNQLVLKVHFISKAKEARENRDSDLTSLDTLLRLLDGQTDKVMIQGGVRVESIQVASVRRVSGDSTDDHLEVRVDKPGDFTTYTLEIDHTWRLGDPLDDIRKPRMDPAYSRCDFNFKAGCPSRFDCAPRLAAPLGRGEEPVIDYMAKDFASFRQALLDLIPERVPDWTERHEADLSIALVESLAYVGDQLSYYQDAVANEAYLETARQRVSIRRHARLIDYRMHDGVSARVFVHMKLKPGKSGTLEKGTRVLSRIDAPLGGARSPHGSVIPPGLEGEALGAAEVVFETMASVPLDSRLNEIRIHTWGDERCCLPPGTTSVDLEGDLRPHLRRGDFLLFEEVKGVTTGSKADAERTHRQIVRLTDVEGDLILDPLSNDPVTGQPPLALTRVFWDPSDRLAFPLCVSARLDDGTYVDNVSVARGNLVLADHGKEVSEWYPVDPSVDPEASGTQTGRRAYRFPLQEGPLSHRIQLDPPRWTLSDGPLHRIEPSENSVPTPVGKMFEAEPRHAKPQIIRFEVDSAEWEDALVGSLLDSGPFDQKVVAETDNDGRTILRFGDDRYGRAPPLNAHIMVVYRVGVGETGNVGAESLQHVIKRFGAQDWPEIKKVYNPLPAWGGVDPEPTQRVKQLAPAAFHSELKRAVTVEDYASAAEMQREVSKAVATFRWTGSWHTVFLTIDPKGRTDVDPPLQERIKNWVTAYTQTGYDLQIDGPTFVPLDLEIEVCASPYHFRAHVEEAVQDALSNRVLPNGRRGFFHHDNFTFGQSLYLSELYAALEAVEGVDSAEVLTFQRSDRTPNDEIETGVMPMDRLEVVRLDNDPNFPGNGVLKIRMRGGK